MKLQICNCKKYGESHNDDTRSKFYDLLKAGPCFVEVTSQKKKTIVANQF